MGPQAPERIIRGSPTATVRLIFRISPTIAGAAGDESMEEFVIQGLVQGRRVSASILNVGSTMRNSGRKGQSAIELLSSARPNGTSRSEVRQAQRISTISRSHAYVVSDS